MEGENFEVRGVTTKPQEKVHQDIATHTKLSIAIYQTHPLTIQSNTTNPIQQSYRDHFVRSQYGLSGIRHQLFATLAMKTKLNELTSLHFVNPENITGRTIQIDRSTAYSFIQDGHSKKSIS